MPSVYLPLSAVKVGESVEYGHKGGWGNYLPQAIVTVTAVGKNFIKTNDGKKWKMADGREWGEKYSSTRLSRFDSTDVVFWEATREKDEALSVLLPLIKRADWHRNLSAAQIMSISEILKSE